MSRNYSDMVERASKEVWEVMHSEATKRGMALTRERNYGDGRVIVGTIGSFVKMLNKERGWGLTESEIDLVRRYLKATGNVVVLSKIEQYRFRIFIREQWSAVAEPVKEPSEGDAISKRAARLTPEEAGETMDPKPVIYKCHCGETFVNQYALNGHKASHASKKKKSRAKALAQGPLIGEKSVKVLRALHELGGDVTDESGFAARILAKKAGVESPVSNACRTLEGLGFIERDQSATRTYQITITDDGREAAMNINRYRPSPEVIRELLEHTPSIESPNGDLYNTLAGLTGIGHDRAANGARTLEDAGVVTITRNGSRVKKIELVDTQYDEERDYTSGVEETVPNFATPDRPKATAVGEVPDEVLVNEVLTRLKARDDSSLETKMEIIASLVDDATQGKIAPLKALSDIQETVNL